MTKFENVPMNAEFKYGTTTYIKIKSDKAKEKGSTWTSRFPAACEVEFDAPVTAQVADVATERQLQYISDLGVDLRGKKISKKLASEIIGAVKSGDGIGFLGFTMRDGSN